MTDVRVAVAIPAFNAATTIGQTLAALQRNDELRRITNVVLLDDCSTDGTAAIAETNWHSAVPLEVWPNARNMGERRTTNAAIERLSQITDWTFILHADDVVKPNWLSLYFDALPDVPETVASVCASYDTWWPSTGRVAPGEEYPDLAADHVQGETSNVIDTLDRGCWWHLSGCAIRNSAFLDIGGFEPDMPQLGDWEWLLRCLMRGFGVWYLPRSIMHYRQHERSISSRSFREARDLREMLRILQMVQSNGYISVIEHRAKVRDVIIKLTRRLSVRLARMDAIGARHHAEILISVGADYLRGKV